VKPPVAICVAVVALLLPATSSATVHVAEMRFIAPSEPPSLEAPLPACEPSHEPTIQERIEEHGASSGSNCRLLSEGDHVVTATYDDEQGSVTIGLEVYNPGYWGPTHAQVMFGLGASCPNPELTGNVVGQYLPRGASYTESEQADTVALQGYTGSVEGHETFSGTTFTWTFRSSAFANRDWRCFSFDGGSQTAAFNGYPEPLPQLVCFTGHYYVGRLRPHNCLIARPNSNSNEVFDLTHLHWTSWSATQATATGYELGSHPGMTGAKPYRVRLLASRPGTDPTTGGPMFTRITEYSSAHPHGRTVRPY